MMNQIVQDADFRYVEAGEGQPIIILHGLMGGLSNFEGVLDYFPPKGYKVIIPELPFYTLPVLKTSVKSLSEFLHDFILHKGLKEDLQTTPKGLAKVPQRTHLGLTEDP